MIEQKEVLELAETIKKRFTGIKNKLPELEDKLWNLTQKYTSALVDGVSDDKLQKITDEITRVEKDIDILGNIDVEKEIRTGLNKDKKLSELAGEFIKQQEAKVEEMLVEDNKLFDDFKAASDALLEAIRARHNHDKKLAAVCDEITDIKRIMGQKIPDGGVLWSYRVRRGQMNLKNLYTRIRGAAGLSLIP